MNTPDDKYQRAPFLNELTRFSLALWGCSSAPPTEFSLIYEQGLSVDNRPITRADADALIEDYMTVVTRNLQLSSAEASSIETVLVELSASVVTSESTEFSRASCEGGAGGQGGVGGEGGAGGQPSAGGEAGLGGAGHEAASGGPN